MKRIAIPPRSGWREKVESQGLHFHTADGEPYWDESAYYQFTPNQIDELEKATYRLNEMCLEAVAHIIAEQKFAEFDIPPGFERWIAWSWEQDERTILGRFDLAYDGASPPKLLEYNADTPTSLLEAAAIQWYWYKDVFGEGANKDQFNSIHERLIEAWQQVEAGFAEKGVPLYFLSMTDPAEDHITTTYLQDTAVQAGFETRFLAIENLGWDSARQEFVDEHNDPIRIAFKLYPWEWMVREPFATNLLFNKTHWLEPPWKMLLSNKAILPVLYHLFPESPYLLRAEWDIFGFDYVRKPCLGREGSNVTIYELGAPVTETDGPYGQGRYIYQDLYRMPEHDGNYPVIGSWMINGYACGIGIREDRGLVTGNLARFVPHVIYGE